MGIQRVDKCDRGAIDALRRLVTGIGLLGIAAMLVGCGGLPGPVVGPEETPTPQAVSATTALPVPPTSTRLPDATATDVLATAESAPRTDTPTATPSAPVTLMPSRTVPLILPATPPPTSTAAVGFPTPIWPPSLLDQTDNILVMGVDYRMGEAAWRTDTIMVVAVDPKAEQVGVISIPRDLYVDLPGFGMARINQADHYGETFDYPGGGAALLRRTLTETLGIPTQHYVRIRMEGLVSLVDALGGVTVTLDCPLFERTPNESSPNGVLDWSLPAGPVHLDGESAKKFATYRYATTDFGRARRQQQLIWAIRDRALQVDILPRIPDLWKALSELFATDLGLLDVARLARLGATLQPDKVHGVVLGDDVMDYYVTPDGAWVLVVSDFDRIATEKDQLFSQRPLASFNVGMTSEGGCPPPPTPPPTYTPLPPPAPEPASTPTPTPAAS